jgi:hypothetical protein
MPITPGIAIGLVQLILAISWTAYAIYLPQLASGAGIARSIVPWLLVLDQAIFALTDWAAGVHADRVLKAMRRLAPLLVLLTLVSTIAFVALPWIGDALGPIGFVAVSVIWVITTAALRAPPMALLGNYAPALRPALASTSLLGLGVAGALAPYLALQLRTIDPRVPFLLAGVGVMIAALTLYYVDRKSRVEVKADAPPAIALPVSNVRWLLLVALLLALGFQAQILALPMQLSRSVPKEQLENFMPAFWIGFCLAAVPAAALCKRASLAAVVGVAASIGGVAAGIATLSSEVGTLAGSHVVAGAAWGVMFTGLMTIALHKGEQGAAGRAAGIVFGSIALLAAARIASNALGWPQSPGVGTVIAWAAALGWILGALYVLMSITTARRARS